MTIPAMKRLFVLLSAALGLSAGAGACGSAEPDPYRFDGSISRDVLDRYLSRAVTMSEFLTVDPYCNDGTYPDKEADVEFIRNTGAKFIGRAIYRWGDEKALTEPGFWAGAEALIDRVHAFDPDVIFQAATFEAVYREVGEVPVPAWAFEALGLPVEERCFDYAQMLDPGGKYVDQWGPGASVPDITRVETQLWFMFLIGSYVDIGVEAVHLGQVYLIGMNDRGWQTWDSFLKKVRARVCPRARRHFVLFDAHAGSRGMMVGDRSLIDFNSFPLRIKEVPEKPMECVLEAGHIDAVYGKSPGCVTPSGWRCDALPYLVEFDNFGVSDHPGKADLSDHYVWGYDEITWFYLQEPDARRAWLRYAYGWLRENDPNGHLEMPGARVVSATAGGPAFLCRAVAQSDRVPYGMGIEETIRELWLGK